MKSVSKRTDAAWDIGRSVMGIFQNLLMEHERKDAFEEIVDVVSKGLEKYEGELARMEKRLNPVKQ